MPTKSAKRQRADGALDDSIQDAIADFKSKTDPSIKDVGELLTSLLETIFSLNAKAYANGKVIEELKTPLKSTVIR